ncbi:MAG: SusC/RagA family TonB-linked outer membrane protein [Bacteroidales bacterium]|nr:SusC/RagA family TonB-linked outer membrane protein [Bacteroidales bacterium]
MLKKLFFTVLMFSTVLLSAQPNLQGVRNITGTIVDENGEKIPFVAVFRKGTTSGVESDDKGRYTIEAGKGDVLVFSYIGYLVKEVTVGDGNEVNVALLPDTSLIEDAVVVGYGSAKKISSIVGSASTVNQQTFAAVSAASSGDILQGKVAGLQVFSSSGEPSTSVSMRIRGINSINASNAPLFILDGSPVESTIFNALNPNDIETMTVLKDASSTAIYGSRAANGVIFITTRKGKTEKATVQASASYGLSNVANFSMDLMNSEEWFSFRETIMPALKDNAQFQKLKDFRISNNIGTDWKEWILRSNAPTWKGDLSVSGRTNKTDYFVSLGAFNQTGVEYFSYLGRYNVRSNINVKVNDWLKVGVNITGTYQDYQTAGYSTTGTGYYNPMNIAAWALPYAVPYEIKTDDSGKFIGYGEEQTYISDLGMQNYFFRMRIQPTVKNTIRSNSNMYQEITPVEGLIIRAAQAVDWYDYRYTGKVLPDENSSLTPTVEEAFERFYRLTSTNTVEYKFDIASKHNFDILAGQESIVSRNQYFSAYTTGHTDVRMSTLSQGTTAGMPTYSSSDIAYNSFFFRASYDFNNKYFIDGTFRTDGSSLFGQNRRYANFFSAGAMWNVKREAFLSDVSWIDKLQMKASYGTTGNSGIDNYLSLGLVSTGTIYDGETSWRLNSVDNPNLTWETIESLNIGINGRLFNVMDFDVSFYNKNTRDMLMYIPYSYQTGFSGGWGNVGSMRNRGIDVELGFDIINTNDWYFGINANMNYNNNVITELYDGRDEFVDGSTGLKFQVGKPYGEYFLVEYAGVDPVNGKQIWRDKDGNLTKEYSESNAVFIGKNRFAPFSGGASLNLRWKDLTFNASFSGVFGKYMENYDRYFVENPSFSDESNMTRRMKNIWTTPGQITDIPKYGEPIKHDSRFIDNASFVRMKNTQLSYSLPKSLFIGSKTMTGAKVYVSGRNLLTFTKWQGFDPEIDAITASGKYPNTKQIVFGAELTF